MGLADIVLMLLVGTFEEVIGITLVVAGYCLTASDIDEQVHVVTGGVALQLFQPLGGRQGYFEGSFIVASHAEQVGQTTGSLCVGVEVFFVCGVTGGFEGCLPVELRQTVLLHPVAGIAFPVVGFRLRQTSLPFQTVGKCQQPVEVSCLVGRLYHAPRLGTLFLTRPTAACRSQHCSHDD